MRLRKEWSILVTSRSTLSRHQHPGLWIIAGLYWLGFALGMLTLLFAMISEEDITAATLVPVILGLVLVVLYGIAAFRLTRVRNTFTLWLVTGMAWLMPLFGLIALLGGSGRQVPSQFVVPTAIAVTITWYLHFKPEVRALFRTMRGVDG